PSRPRRRSTTASRASSALRTSSPSSAGRRHDPPRVPPLASRRQRRRGDARHRHQPRRVPERDRDPLHAPRRVRPLRLGARMTIRLCLAVFFVATAYFPRLPWLYEFAAKKGWLPEWPPSPPGNPPRPCPPTAPRSRAA